MAWGLPPVRGSGIYISGCCGSEHDIAKLLKPRSADRASDRCVGDTHIIADNRTLDGKRSIAQHGLTVRIT
jgi:hypothetical protein